MEFTEVRDYKGIQRYFFTCFLLKGIPLSFIQRDKIINYQLRNVNRQSKSMIRLKAEKHTGGTDFEFFWQEKKWLVHDGKKKRERETTRTATGKEQPTDIAGNGKCYHN